MGKEIGCKMAEKKEAARNLSQKTKKEKILIEKGKQSEKRKRPSVGY